MNNSNTLLVSGGLLMAVSLNDIYTLIAIVAIGLGVLSTVIAFIVKFVNFIKDGKLTREEQQELIENGQKLAQELNEAKAQVEYLKALNEQIKKDGE